jgi:hypothetical protein
MFLSICYSYLYPIRFFVFVCGVRSKSKEINCLPTWTGVSFLQRYCTMEVSFFPPVAVPPLISLTETKPEPNQTVALCCRSPKLPQPMDHHICYHLAAYCVPDSRLSFFLFFAI